MTHTRSSLRAQVLAAASATPSATRQQGQRAGRIVVAASIAIAITVFEGAGGFAHSAGRPVTLAIALSGGWALVAAACTWLALGRGSSTMPRRPALLAGAALVSPFAVFAWMHLFYGSYVEPFQRIGYRCLAYTLVATAVPLAGFLVLRRAVEPRYPAALGAAAGAACATWAGALIDLWCPLTNPLHVLVGHVAPLAAAVAVGALVGHFTLGVRRVRPTSD